MGFLSGYIFIVEFQPLNYGVGQGKAMLRARRQRMVVAQVWLTYRRPELSDVTPYRELIAMNRVIAHTGAKYPIVQAPMGWIARTQLASAVSRAGGLGIIETSSGETEAC